MGSLLIGIGSIAGIGVWLLTCLTFFSNGDTFLGLIALLVPPADLVLPFLISPQLGLLGLGSVVLSWLGFLMKKNS
jgi:hypothetical protein